MIAGIHQVQCTTYRILIINQFYRTRLQKKKVETDIECRIASAVSESKRDWLDEQRQQNSKDIADSIKELNLQIEVID